MIKTVLLFSLLVSAATISWFGRVGSEYMSITYQNMGDVIEMSVCNDSFRILEFNDNLHLSDETVKPYGMSAEIVFSDSAEIYRENDIFYGKGSFSYITKYHAMFPKTCVKKRFDLIGFNRYLKRKYGPDKDLHKYRLILTMYKNLSLEKETKRTFVSPWFDKKN